MKIILKKPIISEKSTSMAKAGQFCFEVQIGARKPEIKSAIEKEFGVHVVSIKTVAVKGEVKMRRGRRGYLTTAGRKKAIVTLKAGQKIGLFTTQAEEKPSDAKAIEGKVEVKEKKSRLSGTKVKIEREKK